VGPITKLLHLIDRMHLALDSSFYPEYLKRQGVSIGSNSSVLYPSYIDGRLPYLVEIGNHVTISLFVTILTHDATTAYAGDLIKVGRVVIRDRSFIGANSTILCNVTIGPNSIVGAGSVVTKDIPPDTVYAGNPAKFVCSTDEFVKRHAEMGKRLPLFEAVRYPHPYISETMKTELRISIQKTSGYFCSRLPEDYHQQKKR
jgi:maltose O-acetyltransferase